MMNILDSNCSCLVMPAVSLIKKFIDIVKIAVPIMLIIFGIIELARAMMSPDEAAMKKAQGSFIKKLIAAVCVFLVPTILNIVTGIIAKGTNGAVETGNWAVCWDNAEEIARKCNGNDNDDTPVEKEYACYLCGNSSGGSYVWSNNPNLNICALQPNYNSKESCEENN